MGEKGTEAAAPVPGSPGGSLFVDSLENSPFSASANPQTTGELGAETIPTQAPSPGAVAGLNAGLSDNSDLASKIGGLNSLGSAPASDNSDLMWKTQMNDLSPATDATDLMNKDRMNALSPASDASDLMNKDRMSAFSPASSYAPPGGGNIAAESPVDLSQRSDT